MFIKWADSTWTTRYILCTIKPAWGAFALSGVTLRDAVFPLRQVWENNRLFYLLSPAATPRRADDAGCSAVYPSKKATFEEDSSTTPTTRCRNKPSSRQGNRLLTIDKINMYKLFPKIFSAFSFPSFRRIFFCKPLSSLIH